MYVRNSNLASPEYNSKRHCCSCLLSLTNFLFCKVSLHLNCTFSFSVCLQTATLCWAMPRCPRCTLLSTARTGSASWRVLLARRSCRRAAPVNSCTDRILQKNTKWRWKRRWRGSQNWSWRSSYTRRVVSWNKLYVTYWVPGVVYWLTKLYVTLSFIHTNSCTFSYNHVSVF